MKLKLLIATGDSDYAIHLSNVLSEKYADTFDVAVCSSAERFRDLLVSEKQNIVLLEESFAVSIDIESIRLPIVLRESGDEMEEELRSVRKVMKYQRISTIVSHILEYYAEAGIRAEEYAENGRAKIVSVWSPAGGSGKTTVALAYAARVVSEGKKALYLNLEHFSSASVYFSQQGKSISTLFSKLDSNVQMLIRGICQQDSASGIRFFSSVDNYEDMNILTEEDIEILVKACAEETDELIVDLSNICGRNTRKVLEMSDSVFLVSDSSKTSQTKLRQFLSQSNLAADIREKSIHIANKGSREKISGLEKTIYLPLVQTTDESSVYKMLSGAQFDW